MSVGRGFLSVRPIADRETIWETFLKTVIIFAILMPVEQTLHTSHIDKVMWNIKHISMIMSYNNTAKNINDRSILLFFS